MDKNIDLNTNFYENKEENFAQAYEMCNKNFTHEELINMLKTGNIPQKQIAALKFDYVNTKNDAETILSCLTGCDGKIREAVALKINQLISSDESNREIFAELSAEEFAKASIDINANICRLVVDSARILKFNRNFSQKYAGIILEYTNQALSELDKFIFRDKKYVINKQLFKLYWCLEALTYFYEYIPENDLRNIIEQCSNQEEYTIREKTAQIIVVSSMFPEIAKKLSDDENYYVRQVFLNHPCIF